MACPTTMLSDASTSTKLHVLVVDDSEFYIQAISRLLATFPCIGTVNQALSGTEALAGLGAAIPDLVPDLVMVDIAMPDMNGLDLARAIKAMPNSPRVIIVTLYDTPAYKEAARAAGAEGFVGKSNLGEDLQEILLHIFPDVC